MYLRQPASNDKSVDRVDFYYVKFKLTFMQAQLCQVVE